MARFLLTSILVLMISVMAGCRGMDTGASQLKPAYARQVSESELIKGSEVDIIEQMAFHRQAYRNGLLSLIEFYEQSGNNMKLSWAEQELAALDKMPQYNYIVEAAIAGLDLRATNEIAEAELMYLDATKTEDQAKVGPLVINEDMLRLALQKYNDLIRRHPSSVRIDDAAYESAGILEHFNDYSLALLYYKRTFQWDQDTPYPARFKAAYILDSRYSRNAEALDLYRQFLEKKDKPAQFVEYAQRRVQELSGANEETLDEKK